VGDCEAVTFTRSFHVGTFEVMMPTRLKLRISASSSSSFLSVLDAASLHSSSDFAIKFLWCLVSQCYYLKTEGCICESWIQKAAEGRNVQNRVEVFHFKHV
jgi:hypothetical protein